MSTCLQKWQLNTRERRTETRTRSGGQAGNRRERFQKSVSYIYIYEIRPPRIRSIFRKIKKKRFLLAYYSMNNYFLFPSPRINNLTIVLYDDTSSKNYLIRSKKWPAVCLVRLNLSIQKGYRSGQN